MSAKSCRNPLAAPGLWRGDGQGGKRIDPPPGRQVDLVLAEFEIADHICLAIGSQDEDVAALPAVTDPQIATLQAEKARLVEALRPFAFLSDDDPNQTTQEAWEIRYKDRVKDWIDFSDIDRARALLAELGEMK